MPEFELNQPKFYLNRELSVLAFNARVLAQAADPDIPLLERLRFLLICDSNLDEFFEIRVAGVKQQIALGSNKKSIDGHTPQEVFNMISSTAHDLIAKKYELLIQQILPALRKENIYLLEAREWNKKQTTWAKNYFLTQVLPVLSPIALDLAHPFPRIVNKSLNFIVELNGQDAFGRNNGLAIIHAPRSLPRVIALPDEPDTFILLSTLISHYAEDLFPGMTIKGCYQFRITRNSELFVDEDKTDDLMLALKTQLVSRSYGNAVRLEVADNCPENLVESLCKKTGLTSADIYRCKGPVNLSRLFALLRLIQRDNLHYAPFSPEIPAILKNFPDIFSCLKASDVLLHHPYQSFTPVVNFIQHAAYDPDVLAIKITLYRTEKNSPIIAALQDAARSGKEVTAIVELRARFDEEENIALANYLQDAGVLIAYGVIGYKTHSKMTLVVRRENNVLKRYVHLSTGNYHSLTATQYTDFSLLTSNEDFSEDVHLIFQELTGMGQAAKLKSLLCAPFTLHKTFMQLINKAIKYAQAGNKTTIIFKLNSLTENQIIQALYRASQAGVKIQLIVRGICCLKPQIPGVSENIQVFSIIARFLEHHRIYYFDMGDDSIVYLSSADMMERNCFYRVEVAFPILDEKLASRVKQEGLFDLLADNMQKWQLDKEGVYHLVKNTHQKDFCAQQYLLEKFKN